jgi:hypothetical protein
VTPIVEPLDLPAAYGRAEVPLDWEIVRARFVAASHQQP